MSSARSEKASCPRRAARPGIRLLQRLPEHARTIRADADPARVAAGSPYSPAKSTIVDSIPTSQAPPSRIDERRRRDRRRRAARSWANAAEPVGRRRGDAASERGKQRARHRVRRHAQADAVLAAGDHVGHMRRARNDQRQRPRPERRSQLDGRLGHIAGPMPEILRVMQVNDHGMVAGVPSPRRSGARRRDWRHRRRVRRRSPSETRRARPRAAGRPRGRWPPVSVPRRARSSAHPGRFALERPRHSMVCRRRRARPS